MRGGPKRLGGVESFDNNCPGRPGDTREVGGIVAKDATLTKTSEPDPKPCGFLSSGPMKDHHF